MSYESNNKRTVLRWMILGSTFVFAGLYLLGRYNYNTSLSQVYIDPDEAYESSEAFFLKKRKAEILENSYNKSIELGNEYVELNELEVAAYKFFDAKSIYPTAIEPRMALSRIMVKQALDKTGDCWQAKKEVLYALKYVRRSENQALFSELQTLKSQLEQQCGEQNNYAFMDDLEKNSQN